jgi:hypothetical protein
MKDGNTESLAERHALFFCPTFAPSLATALALPGDDRYRAFGDQLEARIKQRLATRPAPLNSLVAAMVLVKEDSA